LRPLRLDLAEAIEERLRFLGMSGFGQSAGEMQQDQRLVGQDCGRLA
jgi:hypothetical protein